MSKKWALYIYLCFCRDHDVHRALDCFPGHIYHLIRLHCQGYMRVAVGIAHTFGRQGDKEEGGGCRRASRDFVSTDFSEISPK